MRRISALRPIAAGLEALIRPKATAMSGYTSCAHITRGTRRAEATASAPLAIIGGAVTAKHDVGARLRSGARDRGPPEAEVIGEPAREPALAEARRPRAHDADAADRLFRGELVAAEVAAAAGDHRHLVALIDEIFAELRQELRGGRVIGRVELVDGEDAHGSSYLGLRGDGPAVNFPRLDATKLGP